MANALTARDKLLAVIKVVSHLCQILVSYGGLIFQILNFRHGLRLLKRLGLCWTHLEKYVTLIAANHSES